MLFLPVMKLSFWMISRRLALLCSPPMEVFCAQCNDMFTKQKNIWQWKIYRLLYKERFSFSLLKRLPWKFKSKNIPRAKKYPATKLHKKIFGLFKINMGHTWGYYDIKRRHPMTTLLPKNIKYNDICTETKKQQRKVLITHDCFLIHNVWQWKIYKERFIFSLPKQSVAF